MKIAQRDVSVCIAEPDTNIKLAEGASIPLAVRSSDQEGSSQAHRDKVLDA